ncbi:MAG TPA: DUF2750 domain-containing protein [Chromatiaceae bacterium]|jgi:hypothetical protein|nr:MAG: hypothetical protein N838_06305 [Thiohalocapsa sp. PB-PSB1]QQO52217.1 MAG: DUF2750 domain-containing protein [Thiohalocapsa sp. PB-PSB1]HBG95011.1 DUF2750 domain-containing protein [Chromatiaceae bacterium]HCS92547.1 DUF2750 domain-containing protein [Chromatiaceae bacterium]
MTEHRAQSRPHHEADLAEFVARVFSSGLVWGIKSDQGWAICPSNEYQDASVYPFWSKESAAHIHCADVWADCVPTSIELEHFLAYWLPGMHQDDALVGPDWDEDLAGLEMEPMELAMALGADF